MASWVTLAVTGPDVRADRRAENDDGNVKFGREILSSKLGDTSAEEVDT